MFEKKCLSWQADADRCRSQFGVVSLVVSTNDMLYCYGLVFASLTFFLISSNTKSRNKQNIQSPSPKGQYNINHIKSDKCKWVLHGSDKLKFLSDRRLGWAVLLFLVFYITRCRFFFRKKINKTIELGLTVTSLVFIQYLGSYKTNPGNVQCTVHEIPH